MTFTCDVVVSSTEFGREEMVTTRAEKTQKFQQLHERDGTFVIPNPWDAGSVKLLAALDFEAQATTSAGLAFALGRADGCSTVSRAEALQNAKDIVEATDLPVNADLENGYGHDPVTVAETIRMAADVGLMGGSTEDASGRPDAPIYPLAAAVERVRSAVVAAQELPVKFMVVGRAENFLHGRPDLGDTIQRLQAYEQAGADVLYAPGLTKREDIARVVQSINRPLNVLMGIAGSDLTLADMADLGVRRVSVGSVLSRAALGGFLGAAEEIKATGTFDFASDARPYGDLNAGFGG
ncbi:MAG TPA: isocitrate lyase/phosphoenolpyruvate mutase family protein [Sneathiellales bacterium]|nr:isocitrate lyase/phosphoenolpyruvate mutase family protein [Sneathiellales bacterium]